MTVRLFASYREMVGASCLTLEVEPGATVGDVVRQVCQAHPRLGGLAASLMVAVNREYVTFTTPVHDGDEVALIPPVSGG